MHRKDVPEKESTADSVQSEDKTEESTEKAREKRRATGRTITIIIFVIVMCTAIYHIIQKKTTVLTGVSSLIQARARQTLGRY